MIDFIIGVIQCSLVLVKLVWIMCLLFKILVLAS